MHDAHPIHSLCVRIQQLTVVGFCITVGVAAVLNVGAPPIDAIDTCHKWASQVGNDNNDGSVQRPLKTLRILASQLQPGQTGCVTSGSTLTDESVGFGGFGTIISSGTPAAPITLRPEPGGQATLTGLYEVSAEAHDVVLTGFKFLGAPKAPKAVGLKVIGDRISVIGNEMTNPFGTCLSVGRLDGSKPTVAGQRADDVLIANNRIHDCGTSPTLAWTDGDSGSHGVYVVYSLRTTIRDNLIYDSLYRGVQVYPWGDQVTIEYNLFDHNATHVNIGRATSEGGALPTPPADWFPRNTVVRSNVMANRWTTGGPTANWSNQNTAAIYGFYPANSPTYGNEAYGNCIDSASQPSVQGNGIAVGANQIGNPTYADRAAGNFDLTVISGCVGFGPQSIQPTFFFQPITSIPGMATAAVPAARLGPATP